MKEPTKEQRLANSLDIEGLSRQDEPTAFVPREEYEKLKEALNTQQHMVRIKQLEKEGIKKISDMKTESLKSLTELLQYCQFGAFITPQKHKEITETIDKAKKLL